MTETEAVKGLMRRESRHPPAVTIHRLETALTEKGVKIFARVDFSADAQATGLTLRPELLLMFGTPKAGTPLMVEQPTVGLDLPLKVLAWEDAAGKSWVAFNDPGYIIERHGLAGSLTKNLAAVIPLIEKACDDAHDRMVDQ
jgi:uncharacterized protein (DUF302 family)